MSLCRHSRRPLSIAVSTLFLTACSTITPTNNNARVEQHTKDVAALVDSKTPAPPAKIHDAAAPLEIKPLEPMKQQALERAWLRTKKVDFIPNKKNPSPIPASEILKMFREQGINITSALPLDTYFYNGNGVKSADGEVALQLILGQMGLDYDIDEKGQYVTVVPMKSRSWTINLGNRTSYSANSNFDGLCTLAGAGSGSPNQSGGNGGNQAGGTSGGAGATGASSSGAQGQGTQGNQSGATQQGGTNTTAGGQTSSLESRGQFWRTLEQELTERMKVLVPTTAGSTAQQPIVPAMTMQSGSGGSNANPAGSALYNLQKIGHFTLNPDTGSVTIQAPAWLLRQLDAYMSESVMPKFNTSMTFEGTVVNVRATSDRTAGFDMAALASYAGKYGFVLTNNILGGITMGSNNGYAMASYGGSNLPGGGAAIGFNSPRDNLQIFNAFLTTLGGTEIVNKPIVTVTSGAPVDFGRLTPIYTNEQTQTITPGNVNANPIATIQNNFILHQYGSLLRIMPDYDPHTRRVRAQVSLLQKPLTGFQQIPISLLGLNGTIQTQIVRKPQIECSVVSTEAILDDGELIIIGGQIENTADNNHAGITGLMDLPVIDNFTSQKRDTGSRTTMYFALRVRLNTKPTAVASR